MVRLTQGDYARQTTYPHDPPAVAKSLPPGRSGSTWWTSTPPARPADVPPSRPLAAVRASRTGRRVRATRRLNGFFPPGARVVVGSAALKNWEWFETLLRRPDLARKIVLGLDARDGKLAAQGWTEQTEISAVEVARRCGAGRWRRLSIPTSIATA